MSLQLKSQLKQAHAEKRLVHYEPGIGLRDYALLMEEDGTLVPIDMDALLEYRRTHEFLFPSCLHTDKTGLYCETVLRYGKGNVLAFACSVKGDFCVFWVKIYLGSLSTMSALSSIPSTPERAIFPPEQNRDSQNTPEAEGSKQEVATPSSLAPPPGSQPGSSRGSAGKRHLENVGELDVFTEIKKRRAGEPRKMQLVPLSSPLPQFKSWRQQLVLPSPPPPKHSTRPVRRWPQINPLPSTSTSGGPPSGGAITCAHPNLKPLNLRRLKNIVEKEEVPRLHFDASWGESLKGIGMTTTVVERLLYLCNGCTLYVRADMVTTHRTESCPAIAQLPPPPTIDDSHVALWMLLRVYGLSGSQVQQLFQQCTTCTRFIHPHHVDIHKDLCQAPSPILIPDSDSDPSPTKSYQALGSKGKAREVSCTRIHSPILISDSDSDPSPTKSYQTVASKGKAKEVSRTRIHSPILISDSDAEPKLPLTKGGKAPVSKGKGKEVDRSEVLVVDSSDEDEDMENPSPRKVEKNIEVFWIPMTVAFWMEKSKKKIGKQLNGLDLIKPRFYCCNLLKISFMKTDGGFEGVIQGLSQMPAGGKIDTAR
ncbi:hypothetical protein C8R42DRAFT_637532 [Lentinula raphanica]|nr:hypothetical protein C8R42DRAFT_637532 [Lentinula raphanica]